MARHKPPSPANVNSDRPTLPALKPLRVMVAGEVILDRYIWGDVSRISPEAPIPILRVQRREERPGNAGFVMANLRALGADVSALSVVGSDRNGRLLREIFAALGIATRAMLTDPDRPTTVKDRMLGSVQAAHRGTQQLLRVDEEDPRPLSAVRERELIKRIAAELQRVDGVLISDIDKGMLTPAVLRALIDGGRKRGIPVIVDPRRTSDFSIYRGATALTPNRFETELATGMHLTDRDEWRKAAETLVRKLGLEACLITLDRDGMYLAERGGHDTYVPTAPRDVYDVTGAGDVVLSVFGMFSIAGLGYSSAARIANLAASIEVTRLGTEVITRDDLARALSPVHSSYEHKILSLDELKSVLERERRAGRRIAFTNGCFDLLHAGHVQSLAFARAQADLLVVGLNSDRSVRAIKGDARPIYPSSERARILAAMEAVDYVVIFDDARAEKIIRAVKPDVLIKGDDWRGKTVDGQAFVESRGGRVALAPMLDGRSTTAVIDRLRAPRTGA
ncbi:MAG: bifunctional heptose 7-phosphate kinase/heptose 1-phosphate adenyltransferase [Candidatus Binatus sp.]|uniref:bifunctional heptose 7-phosphate kinase/heptose 1-phosphate adenyltransferase n=1 Tax=Candidatus Binatus sp. TaxID=2811406 RepID=UPI002722E3FE|nr:bifunctional heptose 7-phosphate kinase/heptose 1-phosphate adenyltransferase [Candidatus Binatus sp.]MDO8434372.1 bifunctional heptose 7-phosphate kinase/heptose 1-phosphate adenyltransferase [Candidatus Binatus sp.]